MDYDDMIARVWRAIGSYSVDICRGDADLAPPRELVDAMGAVEAAIRECERLRELLQDIVDTFTLSCPSAHHTKADQHRFVDGCPVVERFATRIDAALAKGDE